MANVWYDLSKTKIGKGLLDLSSLTNPKMIAIETGLYTFSQLHEHLDDVAAGARLATVALAGNTFSVSAEGWLDFTDPTFLSPAVGTIVAFIIYDDSGVENTSPLLLFIDTSSDLPILTESGRDLDVTFSANGVAKL